MNKWFDLHMDTIFELKLSDEDLTSTKRHFSIQNCSEIDEMTVFFAVFVPENLSGDEAIKHTKKHVPYLEYLKKQHPLFMDKCNILLSIENGAALGGKLESVEEFVKLGFKMMTLTWNNGNEIASGHLNRSGRLTGFGQEAVKEMLRTGMQIDISHINDLGFDDVASLTDAPLVASHSNLRSVYNHTRNLTEQQFKEIVRRKGLVGINLHEPFVSSGDLEPKEALYRHIDRMLDLGGEDVLAIGSDYDGADINQDLNTPNKLMGLKPYLLSRGISNGIISKIFYENANNFFKSKI